MSRYRSRSNAPAPSNSRETKSGARGKRGGLFVGLMMGMVLGLVAAAGVAVYLYLIPALRQDKAVSTKPVAATTPPVAAAKPGPAVPPTLESSNQPPAPDYTFYRILQGNAKDKAPAPELPREQYWLQVAALKSPADADRLKAKLALLGMDVAVQKIDNAGAALYRVRVGPFKTENTAMGAMDTLAANQFEPRMIKEAANQR